MCGRIAQFASEEELAEQFDAHFPVTRVALTQRYNGAPTQNFAVIRGNGPRQIEMLRWGLIPHWAKEPGIGNKMINARAETVREKPSFRAAFKSRRCLLPVNGFYEWQKTPGGKIPYYITSARDRMLAFAGLYESWRDPQSPDSPPLRSFTIITRAANDFMSGLHDRMPLVLDRDEEEVWLDSDSPAGDLEALLQRSVAEDVLQAWPVSRRVNNPRTDDAELILPA